MDDNMKSESMVCTCCGHWGGGGHGGWGGHHGHFLLRLIIGIAILVIVFRIGVEVGEFKGMFDGPNADHWMTRGGYNSYQRPMQQMMYYQASPTASPK